jgi:hypothetical protein
MASPAMGLRGVDDRGVVVLIQPVYPHAPDAERVRRNHVERIAPGDMDPVVPRRRERGLAAGEVVVVGLVRANCFGGDDGIDGRSEPPLSLADDVAVAVREEGLTGGPVSLY